MNEGDYLSQLNEQQRAAVTYLDGPSLVISGAGSGKTRVLTYKVLHLLENGFEPESILALTFTNKAAREMKERIAGVAGHKQAYRLTMGTFHSVFLRILRRHADRIGFKKDFTIYDAGDSKSLIKMIVRDLGLDDKIYKAGTVASIISNAKNSLITPEKYVLDKETLEADSRARRPQMWRVYSAYCQRCRLADAMDFDDILVYMNVLLRDNPDLLEYYRNFFQYILVDEYQDTNFAQNLIISTLSKNHGNLCAVGDDAQSIYSFRGANIGNILSMEKQYPGLRIFKLERNYRSTKNIVDAASSLIRKNSGQIPKNTFSENETGEKLTLTEAYNDIEEATITADNISISSVTSGDSYDKYAILYRTNAQSRILEEALRKRNIPYRIYGGITFYQRKEVKDAISYFRLTVNPDDDEALRRVINFPARGIGDTTMKKVMTKALEKDVSLWKVISSPAEYPLNVNSGTRKKLDCFVAIVREFIADLNSGKDAYEVARLIYNRSGLASQFSYDSTPEEISKKENIMELLNGVKEFVDSREEEGEEGKGLVDFLSQVSLATDQDDGGDSDEKVTLMTVHSAKGLEFPHVYIVGMEEHLFPSSLSEGSPSEMEEERRLLYVGITRAMKTCNLSYARSRFRNGETVSGSPSRFLYEIAPEYMKVSGRFPGMMPGAGSRPMVSDQPRRFYKKSIAPLENQKHRCALPSSAAIPGSYRQLTTEEALPSVKVKHQKFGEGEIIRCDSTSGDPVIIVKFKTSGEKKLLLKFAKLEILK